ncbi:MAG: transketolase C-terminal domain-containing protein [Elusimicrobiota bacterium]
MVQTYREAIAQSMRSALKDNPKSIIYGLGVTDFTGIFGTTLNLEKEFGSDRVFDTPLSEESMTGFSVGAALNGIYPIHIYIRVDFLMLAMNQIVNSIAKYKYMYGELFDMPLLMRAIIGRSWGQGAQHSQSLQALFAHIPGLTVIMPSSAQSVIDNYSYAVNKYKSPVLSLEHRLLYDFSFNPEEGSKAANNPFTSHIVKPGKDVTIAATSFMVVEAKNAANFVKEKEGIDAEIIDLHCISHMDAQLLLESVRKTGRLIVADTGWPSFGVCSEVCRIISSCAPELLKKPVINISMAPVPCPTAKTLENYFYPDIGTLVDSIYKLVLGKERHGKELPSADLKRKLYKEFKGPF